MGNTHLSCWWYPLQVTTWTKVRCSCKHTPRVLFLIADPYVHGKTESKKRTIPVSAVSAELLPLLALQPQYLLQPEEQRNGNILYFFLFVTCGTKNRASAEIKQEILHVTNRHIWNLRAQTAAQASSLPPERTCSIMYECLSYFFFMHTLLDLIFLDNTVRLSWANACSLWT